MTPELKTAFNSIPQLSQRQDGNLDQLADLLPFAEKLGLTQASSKITKLLADRRDADPDSSFSMPFPQKSLDSALSGFGQFPASEMSERDELYLLRSFANRLGLYDAADTLKMLADRPPKFKP